jgi:homogentisate 1,2-dioxygenase
MYLTRKGQSPRQAHVNIPSGFYEEEHGRKGFAGPASHLYRAHPPTNWLRIEGPCRPRAFNCLNLEASGDHKEDRPVELLRSPDARLFVSNRKETMSYYFRNADGDELYFVHQGRGLLETDYGVLAYEPGDYLLIPKGTTYRMVVEEQPAVMLLIETPEPFMLPERGLLGHHALFDPEVLAVPELPTPVNEKGQKEWEPWIKREGTFTKVVYPFSPLDVIGWKGDVWPTKLNVRDFRPVTSPRYHLPPSVHATFQAGGVWISTFAPRPLESDPGALKIPFYHRNIDFDEVLFYHEGNFFSRSDIRPGTLTLHPQGIHHGPHPGAVEASKTQSETNEIAVMVESRHPFYVMLEAEAVELKNYAMSWSTP